jgi:hypothetical protein
LPAAAAVMGTAAIIRYARKKNKTYTHDLGMNTADSRDLNSSFNFAWRPTVCVHDVLGKWQNKLPTS